MQTEGRTAARCLGYALIAGLALSAPIAAAWAQPAVYVVNVGSNDVSVIDPGRRVVVATIPVGTQPNGVAVTPDGGRVYVSNFRDNTVSAIDAVRRTAVATIAVGSGPVGIAIAPDGRRAYVANRESDTVSVIDVATDAVTATIDGVGPGSNGIALTPDGARAYVNNASSTDPGTVSVVDLATGSVVNEVAVYRNPKRVAIAPDGRTAYVANFRSWNISVVDVATNSYVTGLRVSGRTVGTAVHPNGQYAYITNLDGTVEVLETATDLLIPPIAVGREPYAIALSGQGGEAYVANLRDDTVSVVDLARDQAVATIPVGSKPFAIAWGCLGDSCDLPPFTPRPTGTATPTPTITGTPTITRTPSITPTPPPDPNAVQLRLGNATGRAGGEALLSVSLDARQHEVAGVQVDILFSESVRIAENDSGDPDCLADARLDKQVLSTFQPSGCVGTGCNAVRFLVLDIYSVDPITVTRLFGCRLAIAGDAAPGVQTLYAASPGASDPRGNPLVVETTGGQITVLGNALIRGAASRVAAVRLCSGGAADGSPCGTDADCAGGICVSAGSVCDGGADDGLLCDCPSGTCFAGDGCDGNPAHGTCGGGGRNGLCCDADFSCAGERACVPTQHTCRDGVAKGVPCLRDAHCPGSVCESSGRACGGGDYDGVACVDDRDCPLGICRVSALTEPTQIPTGASPTSAGSGGGGCAIGESACDGSAAWLLLIAAALRRWRRR